MLPPRQQVTRGAWGGVLGGVSRLLCCGPAQPCLHTVHLCGASSYTRRIVCRVPLPVWGLVLMLLPASVLLLVVLAVPFVTGDLPTVAWTLGAVLLGFVMYPALQVGGCGCVGGGVCGGACVCICV